MAKRDWQELGEKLESVWPHADGLVHAFKLADVGISDVRTMNRHKKELEAMGYDLPTHKPQHKSEQQIECPSTLKIKKGTTDFVVTSCTNNSPIDEGMFESLKKFCKAKKAQLIVIPINYRNTSIMHNHDDYTWPAEIYPYVLKGDHDILNRVRLSGARILPTVQHPLSRKHAIGRELSVIYGHPQVAKEMIATTPNRKPKMMHTTGSLNDPLYSSSNIGTLAFEHHSYAAVYVKVNKKGFDFAQLGWADECFYYLDEQWSVKGKKKAKVSGYHMGDHHSYHMQKYPDVLQWKKDNIKKLGNYI